MKKLMLGFIALVLLLATCTGVSLVGLTSVTAYGVLSCQDAGIYLPPLDVEIDWEGLEEALENPELRQLGKGEGGSLQEVQKQGLVYVVGVSAAWRLGERDLTVALIAAAEESLFDWTLTASDSDLDSQNLYQQRPSQGWGTVEQLADPVYAVNAFIVGVEINNIQGLLDIENRDELEVWEIAQAVQKSGAGKDSNGLDNYGRWVDVAEVIIAHIDQESYNQGVDFSSIGCPSDEDASGSSSELAQAMANLGLLNGRLDPVWLVEISPGCLVTTFNGAATQASAMMEWADQTNAGIKASWCYRDYETQYNLYWSRMCNIPGNCDGDPYPPTAYPGTSNHGWGLAIDFTAQATASVLTCGSFELAWMEANAPLFGWKHPDWAHCDKSSREAWHWEYTGLPALVGPDPPQ